MNKPTSAKGFEVGPTINACTKGLWVWDRLLEGKDSQGRKIGVLVIDSEGLNSTEVESNYDNRVFMFCLLLSSLFIYNSMGTIDENALQNINLIINLALKIKIKDGHDKATEEEISEAFPSLLWVLRDAFLSQEDLKGNKLTPKEYLESALQKQNGMSNTIFNKNKIRIQIKKFFASRDCLRFVRPVEDEGLLKNLDKVDEKFLRKEFVGQISSARKQIFNKMKVKTYHGQTLSPKLMVELAKSYLTAINEHQELNIESSWKYVVRGQANKAKINALAFLGNLVSKINLLLGGAERKTVLKDEKPEDIKVDILAREALGTNNWEIWKSKVKREVVSIFRKKCIGEKDSFTKIEMELDEVADEKLKSVGKSITNTIKSRVKKKLRNQFDVLSVKAVEGELDIEDLKRELDNVFVSYINEELGQELLDRVQSQREESLGIVNIEELYERFIECSEGEDEISNKAKIQFLNDILGEDRKFLFMKKYIKEKENNLLELLVKGREKKLEDERERLREEFQEDILKMNQQREKVNETQQETIQHKDLQLAQLKDQLAEKDNQISKLENELDFCRIEKDKPQGDPEEIKRLREDLLKAEQAAKGKSDNQRDHLEKIRNLEMMKEMLENQVTVMRNEKHDLKKYFEDFMMKYKMRKELEDSKEQDREVERSLSEAVNQLTARNKKLEDKLKKLKQCKTMVKHAASFECKLCYEQILDSEFHKHILDCTTGRSKIVGRSGNMSRGISTLSAKAGRDLNFSSRLETSHNGGHPRQRQYREDSINNTSLQEINKDMEGTGEMLMDRMPGFSNRKYKRNDRNHWASHNNRQEGGYRNASMSRIERDSQMARGQTSKSIRSTRRVHRQEPNEELPVLRSLVDRHNMIIYLKQKVIPSEIGIEIEHTRVKMVKKDSDNPFIFYEIKVFYGDQLSHVVYRKMLDFCSLCKKLEKMFDQESRDMDFIEDFKIAIDKMLKNRTQIESRKKILEGFLQELVEREGNRKNPLFFRFLGLERLANMESKIMDQSKIIRGEDTFISMEASREKVLRTVHHNLPNRAQGESNHQYENSHNRSQQHINQSRHFASNNIIGQNNLNNSKQSRHRKMTPVSIYRTEDDEFQIRTREYTNQNNSRVHHQYFDEQNQVNISDSRLQQRDRKELGRPERYQQPRRNHTTRNSRVSHKTIGRHSAQYNNNTNPGFNPKRGGFNQDSLRVRSPRLEDEEYMKKLSNKKELIIQQSNLLYSHFEDEIPTHVQKMKESQQKNTQGEGFYEGSEDSESDKEDIPVENTGEYDTLLESKENFHSQNQIDSNSNPNQGFFESEEPVRHIQNFDIEGYKRGEEEEEEDSSDEKESYHQTREEKFEEIKQSSRQLRGMHNMKKKVFEESQKSIKPLKKGHNTRIYRKRPYRVYENVKF